MTIDEAIKILGSGNVGYRVVSTAKVEQAEKLGAEALKRIRFYRRVDNHPDQAPLPGETEE